MQIRKALWGVCDVSMPRIRKGCGRRSAYWWTEEIASLRDASVQARRRLQRCLRRRNNGEACIERTRSENRNAQRSLCSAIGRSKIRAWEELNISLDEDPWKRPYRLILKKLRLQPRSLWPLVSSGRWLRRSSPGELGARCPPLLGRCDRVEGGLGGDSGRNERCCPEDEAKQGRIRRKIGLEKTRFVVTKYTRRMRQRASLRG